jgi:protein phosphatase methylesterase 1
MGVDEISILLIHGAGYSHTTFNALVPYFKEYNVITLDLPGHGDSLHANGDYCSMESFKECIDQIMSQNNLKPESTAIIGHSLGGSIATFYPNCLSVILIDISEGPALKTLDRMPLILERRPKTFRSLKDATAWYKRLNPFCEIPEESIAGQLKLADSDNYTWRVDLLQTKSCWRGWFENMDARFLACNNPLLVLSDKELLDKTLLIASMQGKFQLRILANTGHAIQEDQPRELASIILAHLGRIAKSRQTLSARGD